MNKSLVTLILLCSCVFSGCRDGGPVDPAVTPPELLELWQNEQQVIANCNMVRDAAEAFAADNNGVYPWLVAVDKNLSGNSLIDLLPGGVNLENPFTGYLSEPINGSAFLPGGTGYLRFSQGGVPVGYTITGVGETDSKIIFTLTQDGVVEP